MRAHGALRLDLDGIAFLGGFRGADRAVGELACERARAGGQAGALEKRPAIHRGKPVAGQPLQAGPEVGALSVLRVSSMAGS